MKSLLNDVEIQTLSREESVRGLLVKSALEQLADADEGQAKVIEDALTLLLKKFQAFAGEDS